MFFMFSNVTTIHGLFLTKFHELLDGVICPLRSLAILSVFSENIHLKEKSYSTLAWEKGSFRIT